MSITARIRGMDLITGVIVHTDPVMAPTQAPSRSKLAIGPIILVALVIMQAAPITSGGQDIGRGAGVKESGFTATTF